MENLPDALAQKQTELRKRKKDPEFDIVESIITRYNKGGESLPAIAADLGFERRQLTYQLECCGIMLSRKLVRTERVEVEAGV